MKKLTLTDRAFLLAESREAPIHVGGANLYRVPEGALAMVRPWGVMGVLVSHQWDVAGENDYDTSITGGQYFYAFNMGGGWQINGSPTFSYNHDTFGPDYQVRFSVSPVVKLPW